MSADARIAGMMRGDVESLPLPPDDPAVFLASVGAHGVDCLLWRSCEQGELWRSLPPAIRTVLTSRARHESALEMARQRELMRVLTALRAAEIRALVFKGASLAYTHYPAAYLRTRCDSDLLVKQQDRAATARALEALGYQRLNSLSGGSVHTQWMFERTTHGSTRHVVDLHWAISNRPLFASMLTFDEVYFDAVTVTSLGDGCLAPAPHHALILACIHRVAHHHNSPRLLWLYDIKLLVERFSPAESDVFLELATQKRLLAVCADSLAAATEVFGLRSTLTGRLQDAVQAQYKAPEPSAAYLGGSTSHIRSLVMDVSGAAGIAAKVRLLTEHAFPDAQYMRRAYDVHHPVALATAYAHRAARGLWRAIIGRRQNPLASE